MKNTLTELKNKVALAEIALAQASHNLDSARNELNNYKPIIQTNIYPSREDGRWIKTVDHGGTFQITIHDQYHIIMGDGPARRLRDAINAFLLNGRLHCKE